MLYQKIKLFPFPNNFFLGKENFYIKRNSFFQPSVNLKYLSDRGSSHFNINFFPITASLFLFPTYSKRRTKKKLTIPGETGEDIEKIVGYSVSPSFGVHSTFKILPMSSCFGQ